MYLDSVVFLYHALVIQDSALESTDVADIASMI